MATRLRGAALVLLAACLAGPAAAAMYRCGNVFQDRPCDAGVPEQRIVPGMRPGTTATAPSAAASPASRSPFAVACGRVGEQAQGIVWKREGGATLEKQLAEAGGNGELAATIHSVYSRRGTAPEIRAAIEAECIAERQKAAEAAEALKALQKQAGQVPRAADAADAAPPAAPAAAPAPAQATPVAARPDPRCASWRDQHANVESQLRRGGSAGTMESLQNQRRCWKWSWPRAAGRAGAASTRWCSAAMAARCSSWARSTWTSRSRPRNRWATTAAAAAPASPPARPAPSSRPTGWMRGAASPT